MTLSQFHCYWIRIRKLGETNRREIRIRTTDVTYLCLIFNRQYEKNTIKISIRKNNLGGAQDSFNIKSYGPLSSYRQLLRNNFYRIFLLSTFSRHKNSFMDTYYFYCPRYSSVSYGTGKKLFYFYFIYFIPMVEYLHAQKRGRPEFESR
jgi:hypothetical protein